MGLSGATKASIFPNEVEGVYGKFSTPAGEVEYLQTKARLGFGNDPEVKLTRYLTPVREAIPPTSMNFNQLLQRDLDDHRVATGLIPYLLQGHQIGPTFFPPILAVLLPFDEKGIDEAIYPDPSAPEVVKSDDDLDFLEQRHGETFRVRKLAAPDGQLSHIKFGRLAWDDDVAKLIVIDGQHRAMALVAIDRTVRESWAKGSGSKYRSFYEDAVRRLLDESGFDTNKLSEIEVPVTILWFPSQQGPERTPHKAARKLFVDVNKEARAPSESRLTLLSDTKLENIFVRAILNSLRGDNGSLLPLSAVEYDYPGTESAKPVRWNVLCNLGLLKSAVLYTIFCPKRFAKQVDVSFGGAFNWQEANNRLRKHLDVQDFMKEREFDGEKDVFRDEVGDTNFPLSKLEEINTRFMSTWGDAIVRLVAQTAPYQEHIRALKELRGQWSRTTDASSLAFDAVFDGVGVYWVLRDSYQHWLEQRKELGAANAPKPETCDAWDALKEKEKWFSRRRAENYLKQDSVDAVNQADEAYGVMNTHACQLGAVLTLTAVAERADIAPNRVPALAEALAKGWSDAFASEVNQSRNRRLVFCGRRTISKPLNRISKMDSPNAVHFRYFWLELLRLPMAYEHVREFIEEEDLEELVTSARVLYLKYLVKEQEKRLKASEENADPAARYQRAVKLETDAVASSLCFWFDYAREDARDAVNAIFASNGNQAVAEDVEETGPADESEDMPEQYADDGDIDSLLDDSEDDG